MHIYRFCPLERITTLTIKQQMPRAIYSSRGMDFRKRGIPMIKRKLCGMCMAAIVSVSVVSLVSGVWTPVYGAQMEEYTGAFSVVEQAEYMNDPNLTLASVQCGFAPFISYPGKTIHLHFHELNTDTYYIFSTDKFQDGDVTITLPVGTYQLSGSIYDDGVPSTDYPVYMYPEQFTLYADGTVTDDSGEIDRIFIEITHEKNSITKTSAYQSVWSYPGFGGQLTYHMSGLSDNHEPLQCDYDISTEDYGKYAFYVKDILTGTYEVTDIHAYDRDGNEVNVYYPAEKRVKIPGSRDFEYNKMEFYIYRDVSDLPEGFLRLLAEEPEAWKTTQVESTIAVSEFDGNTDIPDADKAASIDTAQETETVTDSEDTIKSQKQDSRVQKRENSRKSFLVFLAAALLVGVVEFRKNREKITEFLKERRK